MSTIGQLAKVASRLKPHDMSDKMLKYLDMLDEYYEIGTDRRYRAPMRCELIKQPETHSNKLFFLTLIIKGAFFAYSEFTGKTSILKNVSHVAQAGFFFAVTLIKRTSFDSTDSLAFSLERLQRQNQEVEPLPAQYQQIARLLVLLHANFQPGIERGRQQVAEAKRVQEQQQAQVQEMSNNHQRLPVLKTQAILHVFMSILLLKMATHGRTITVIPRMLEDLSAARSTVDNAEKRLQTKKDELAQVIKEIDELKHQIQQVEQEKDPAMDGLLRDLKFQVSTLTARYQLHIPQPTGTSHGSLVRA